jgi:RNA polymerase sigma-70 factor (ECF subfamily)
LALAQECRVVILACAGDENAFEELVRRRQVPIRGLLRRLCRDASLGDDLMQDTFLQAWKSIRTLRCPETFGDWLRKIAVNKWRQHARDFKSVERMDEIDVDSSMPAANTQIAAFDLESALEILRPERRLCVVLAYHEGLSQMEISTTTGIPLGTVKKHLAEGTRQLRDLLNAYCPVPVE